MPRRQSESAASTARLDGPRMDPTWPAFEEHLADHGIMVSFDERPSNFSDVVARLKQPNDSIPADKLDEEAWTRFSQQMAMRGSLKMVQYGFYWSVVVSNLDGSEGGGDLFNRLDPLIEPDILVRPRPMLYDGIPSRNVDYRIVRNKLSGMIAPATDMSRPYMPNFFFHIRGHGRGQSVPQEIRRLLHLGSLGARGVATLRAELGLEDPKPNMARTIVSFYDAREGILEFFTVHILESAAGRPGREGRGRGQKRRRTEPTQYRMAPCYSVEMRDWQGFQDGVRVLANAREWAREQRDELLEPLGEYAAMIRREDDDYYAAKRVKK